MKLDFFLSCEDSLQQNKIPL